MFKIINLRKKKKGGGGQGRTEEKKARLFKIEVKHTVFYCRVATMRFKEVQVSTEIGYFPEKGSK